MFRIARDTRRRNLDYERLRKLVADFREVEPFPIGDFYPLTPYSRSNDVWLAWQFDRPDLAAGVIQAFRRASAPVDSVRLRLWPHAPSAG